MLYDSSSVNSQKNEFVDPFFCILFIDPELENNDCENDAEFFRVLKLRKFIVRIFIESL